MINFGEIILNENTRDVIVFFARSKNGISYPQLDGFFSRYRQEVHQTGEFLTTIENLIQEKVIVIDAKMTVIKGPNWKEPKFVTEKKYGIV